MTIDDIEDEEDQDGPVEDNPVLIQEGKCIYAQVERDGVVVRERISRHIAKLPEDKQEWHLKRIAVSLRIKLNRAHSFRKNLKVVSGSN